MVTFDPQMSMPCEVERNYLEGFQNSLNLVSKKKDYTRKRVVICSITFTLYYPDKDTNWFRFHLIKDICRNLHENGSDIWYEMSSTKAKNKKPGAKDFNL